MFYTYIICSINHPDRIYVGYTENVEQRFQTHNSGGSIYTAQYRPWKLIAFMAFESQETAKSFEKYLKTSAGKAFTKKRFLQ